MKAPTTFPRLTLRILGVLMLVIAGMRLATSIAGTIDFSKPESTDGFIVGVGIDFTTLAVSSLGVLLCVLGFGGQKHRPQ